MGFPGGSVVKNLPANEGAAGDVGSIQGAGRFPGGGNGNPLQYSCLERRRSLVGCSPWGREESDRTQRLPFHFSLSCIEEGNGNSLQCSCLENPRDGGAWWAAVYGVSLSRTRLKWFSSIMICIHPYSIIQLFHCSKNTLCSAYSPLHLATALVSCVFFFAHLTY